MVVSRNETFLHLLLLCSTMLSSSSENLPEYDSHRILNMRSTREHSWISVGDGFLVGRKEIMPFSSSGSFNSGIHLVPGIITVCLEEARNSFGVSSNVSPLAHI